MIWGFSIALYLFLAGAGACAFAACALVALRKPEVSSFQKIGRVVSLAAVVIGMVLLMVDARAGLMNPLRFTLLLGNFGSVMTWGVVFLGLFTVVNAITVVLAFMKKPLPKWLDVFGIVLAVCVAVYTGVLLGVVDTFPLWNLAVLPVLFFVSAVSTGIATAALVARAVGEPPATLEPFQKLRAWLSPVELAVVCVLLIATFGAGPVGTASVYALTTGGFAPAFWLGFVVVGLAVPFFLESGMVRRRVRATAGGPPLDGGVGALPVTAIVGDVCVLVGGLLLRYLVIAAALPLTVPALGI